MGYLGSDIDDYYSYQLLDIVANQIDSNDTGDWSKLQDSLNIVVEKFTSTARQNLLKAQQGDKK